MKTELRHQPNHALLLPVRDRLDLVTQPDGGPTRPSTVIPVSIPPTSISAVAAAAGWAEGTCPPPRTVCFSEARGAGREGVSLRPGTGLWGDDVLCEHCRCADPLLAGHSPRSPGQRNKPAQGDVLLSAGRSHEARRARETRPAGQESQPSGHGHARTVCPGQRPGPGGQRDRRHRAFVMRTQSRTGRRRRPMLGIPGGWRGKD